MNRVYGEPANVQARPDGRPSRFVWQNGLYAVSAILEHWIINREWWREPPPCSDRPEPGQPGSAQPGSAQPGPAQPGADGTQLGRPAAGEPELEFWRVEASSGPGTPRGVYELRRDAVTGTWTLRSS
jgi:hypothetical protein